MHRTPKNMLLQYLRKLVPEPDTLALSDRELLRRFAEQRDETAFTLLVRRHGPMVLRLCQRLLQNTHDAEDVCQATFLVLATKAASRYWQPSVASWLYRVAYHLARKAKTAAVRRTIHERQVVERPMPDPLETISGRELLSVLDEELQRLPEKYRAPLVLCYLQGATRDQAARQLGCPLGTLKHRVERGRELLHVRLVKRGVTLSAALSIGALVENPVNAALSVALWERVVHGALAFTGTKTGILGTISVQAVQLAEGALKSMALTKLKIMTALLLVVSLVAGGVGAVDLRALWAGQSGVQNEPAPQLLAEGMTQAKTETEKPRPSDRYGDPLPEGAIARIGTSRMRAQALVNVIAFSQDGVRLAYGSEDGHAYICKAVDGKLLLDLRPDDIRIRPVTELAFSPDGQTLAVSGYWSEAVWLIDIATGIVRYRIPNAAEGQMHWGRECQGPGFLFTPDGRTLVIGGKDGALHLWDTATGTEQAALPAEKEMVQSLTLTADGRTALTAHSDGALHLWDLTNRGHLRKLRVTAKYPHFTALAPHGKTIVLVSGATELELWDPEDGRRHPIRTLGMIAGVGFSPDGATLLVADGNGNVTAWDVRTSKKRTEMTCGGISLRKSESRMGPKPLAWFRPDGKAMVWSVGGTIRPWDLTTGQETPRLGLYHQGIEWVGFSSDGRLLRAAGWTGELGVWDAATGRAAGPYHKINMPPGPRTGPHYTRAPDRGSVVAVTCAEDLIQRPKPGKVQIFLADDLAKRPKLGEGQIFLWDPAGNSGPTPLREQVAPAWYATLTPDNCFLVATEAPGQIQVYNAATGKPTRSFPAQDYELWPTFSPSGAVLATRAKDGAIRMYNFATGGLLRELKGLSPAYCLAFAPDGQSLASGHVTLPPPLKPSQPGDLIYLWDTASGRELRRIPTGQNQITAVSFSPDGRLIASCGVDRLVHLWEAASGQERRRYEGHRSWVQSVDFAPDGGRVASASFDNTVLVWRVFDPASTERSVAELDALWNDLTKDGITTHRAIAALIAAKGSVSLLQARLKPAVKPSESQLKTWLAALASPVFKTREAAQQEMARTGELVEPVVRRALQLVTDREVQGRLTDLLDHMPWPQQLRDLRAVEVLEHIDNAEARRLLGDLANGTPEARLTREAKASLKRLSK